MTRYTEELLKLHKNFFSLKGKNFLDIILEDPSNYSIFCLFKDYDEEKLYNLSRSAMRNLSKEGITPNEKLNQEKFLAIVLGAFKEGYEENQKESNSL